MVVSQEPNAGFMRSHSFDFGYYANVPDFIWKRPATYATERNEHYVNLEIYEREFAKHPEVSKPFELSRKELETKFPDLHADAGRAYWRVRELNDRLSEVTKQLKDLKEPTGEARQKLQAKWMVIAGVMAHYVGDLGMPLHVTENHDGQLTNQKGIHSYFEDVIVDQLYPEIDCEVNREAMKQWPAFSKKNSGKSVLELLEQVSANSMKAAQQLLTIDKKSDRKNLKKNVQAYHAMIRQRLVDSALVVAELYRRQLGFPFDDKKFYFFAGEPEYIQPAEGAAPPPQKK